MCEKLKKLVKKVLTFFYYSGHKLNYDKKCLKQFLKEIYEFF